MSLGWFRNFGYPDICCILLLQVIGLYYVDRLKMSLKRDDRTSRDLLRRSAFREESDINTILTIYRYIKNSWMMVDEHARTRGTEVAMNYTPAKSWRGQAPNGDFELPHKYEMETLTAHLDELANIDYWNSVTVQATKNQICKTWKSWPKCRGEPRMVFR